jgi:hypothetical protein
MAGTVKRNLAVILFAAVVAAASAIAISQAASTPAQRSMPASASKRSLYAHFSILRSAKNASSSSAGLALPALTAQDLTEPGTQVSEYELEPARAAYLQIDSATHGWVIPGRRGMCLAVSKGISLVRVCDAVVSVESSGLVMVSRSTSRLRIFGLAPDDSSVVVTGEDGATTEVPVTSNVFTYAGPNASSVAIRTNGQAASVTPIR